MKLLVTMKKRQVGRIIREEGIEKVTLKGRIKSKERSGNND